MFIKKLYEQLKFKPFLAPLANNRQGLLFSAESIDHANDPEDEKEYSSHNQDQKSNKDKHGDNTNNAYDDTTNDQNKQLFEMVIEIFVFPFNSPDDDRNNKTNQAKNID